MKELEAIYDSRKSFYGKAHIKNFEDKDILVSYDTKIAIYDKINEKINIIKCKSYSNTTIRHIREFIKQNGFDGDMTKKELLQTYIY